MDWTERFRAFVERKTATALNAKIPGYRTLEAHGETLGLHGLGNVWTTRLFDGPFFESAPPGAESQAFDKSLPAINTVFVQSADGNTGTPNPTELGGGLTDKHLIYEGLSSVHADAIITGASTIRGEQMIMAIWHPELVALRASLGLPRYPAQVVATNSGDLDVESSLLYNVPELRVFILTADAGARALGPYLSKRPWIQVLNGGARSDVIAGLKTLKAKHGIARVSSIGGRTLTTQLIEKGVVQDIYLTTAPKIGGEPGTPFYTGAKPLDRVLVVRKSGRAEEKGVVFEHFLLSPP